MVDRDLLPHLRRAARRYPVVTLTGPRQSGKTTLSRAAFPDLPYVNFEALDERERAIQDPRGLLAEYGEGAIFDEVQRVPDLLSYLQAAVDERPRRGRFLLTGSENLALSSRVAQSLAGRTAMLHLLPLSRAEVRRFPRHPEDLWEAVFAGGYPAIHDRAIPPPRWQADYAATYVERDVRQLLRIGDLHAFGTFLRLCAGRTAQEIHLGSLGADAGITHNTSRAWLSVLEASFLVQRLPPWFRHPGKRAVKTAKLHWVDTGLACHLLGIRDAGQLRHHPLRGALFESWVAGEIAKSLHNTGEPADLFHLRRTLGIEVDLLVERGNVLLAVECKSGETPRAEFGAALERLRAELAGGGTAVEAAVAYGGRRSHSRGGIRFTAWEDLPDLLR